MNVRPNLSIEITKGNNNKIINEEVLNFIICSPFKTRLINMIIKFIVDISNTYIKIVMLRTKLVYEQKTTTKGMT
jgi:hypothetical protein